jgi:hypothetical protein
VIDETLSPVEGKLYRGPNKLRVELNRDTVSPWADPNVVYPRSPIRAFGSGRSGR